MNKRRIAGVIACLLMAVAVLGMVGVPQAGAEESFGPPINTEIKSNFTNYVWREDSGDATYIFSLENLSLENEVYNSDGYLTDADVSGQLVRTELGDNVISASQNFEDMPPISDVADWDPQWWPTSTTFTHGSVGENNLVYFPSSSGYGTDQYAFQTKDNYWIRGRFKSIYQMSPDLESFETTGQDMQDSSLNILSSNHVEYEDAISADSGKTSIDVGYYTENYGLVKEYVLDSFKQGSTALTYNPNSDNESEDYHMAFKYGMDFQTGPTTEIRYKDENGEIKTWDESSKFEALDIRYYADGEMQYYLPRPTAVDNNGKEFKGRYYVTSRDDLGNYILNGHYNVDVFVSFRYGDFCDLTGTHDGQMENVNYPIRFDPSVTRTDVSKFSSLDFRGGDVLSGGAVESMLSDLEKIPTETQSGSVSYDFSGDLKNQESIPVSFDVQLEKKSDSYYVAEGLFGQNSISWSVSSQSSWDSETLSQNGVDAGAGSLKLGYPYESFEDISNLTNDFVGETGDYFTSTTYSQNGTTSLASDGGETNAVVVWDESLYSSTETVLVESWVYGDSGATSKGNPHGVGFFDKSTGEGYVPYVDISVNEIKIPKMTGWTSGGTGYGATSVSLSYDTWYKVRFEMNMDTGDITYEIYDSSNNLLATSTTTQTDYTPDSIGVRDYYEGYIDDWRLVTESGTWTSQIWDPSGTDSKTRQIENISYGALRESSVSRNPENESTVIDDSETNYKPSVAVAPNDNIVLAYRSGPSEPGNDGRIRLMETSDGNNWSSPTTILDNTNLDDRDPQIFTTENGTIITIHSLYNASTSTKLGAKISYSYDNGESWTDPIWFVDKTGQNRENFVYNVSSKPEIVNGDIYLPAYGYESGTTNQQSVLFKSTDNGESWSLLHTFTSNYMNEWALEYIGNDNFVSVHRNAGQDTTYKYYSSDLGQSWSSPTDITSNVDALGDPEIVLHNEGGENALILQGRRNLTNKVLSSWFTTNLYGSFGNKYDITSDGGQMYNTATSDIGFCDVFTLWGEPGIDGIKSIEQNFDVSGENIYWNVEATDTSENTGWFKDPNNDNLIEQRELPTNVQGENFQLSIKLESSTTTSSPSVQNWNLTVSDADANSAPTASFTADDPKLTGEDINFDASGSTDSDGTIENYAWDWTSDGTYELSGPTETTPAHSYADDGSYDVTLKVWDNGGATDTTTADVTVNNRSPTADFTYSQSELTVSFDGSGSSDPDGSISSYSWDPDNDGTWENSGETTSYTYASEGDYDAMLRVTDDDSATDNIIKTISVTVNDPAIIENLDNYNISRNEATLSADIDDPEDDTIQWVAFLKGDDTVIENKNVSDTPPQTYSTIYSGLTENTTYDWKVEAKTSGTTTSSTYTFTTDSDSPPTASFTHNGPALTDETVNFDASGSSDDYSISSYEWDWTSDGTYEGTGETATHSYPDNGTYTVKLRVTDDAGQTDTTTKDVTINNRSPTADFTYTIDNLTVDVDASSSSDPDGTINSYEWNWTADEDSTYDNTGQNTTHTYSSENTYTIELKITDDDGATDTITKTIDLTTDEDTDDDGGATIDDEEDTAEEPESDTAAPGPSWTIFGLTFSIWHVLILVGVYAWYVDEKWIFAITLGISLAILFGVI